MSKLKIGHGFDIPLVEGALVLLEGFIFPLIRVCRVILMQMSFSMQYATP